VLQASLFLLSGNSPADVFVVLSTAGRIALTQMGDWKYVTMTKVAASVGASTRSQRSEMSSQRRTLAQGISPAEIIAMESADDPEGFSFWLARAEGPAFQYDGPRVCEAGRLLIPGGWYIKVCYYDRFPPTSVSTFKLNPETYIENVEGVISRNVAVVDPRWRSTRRAVSAQHRATLISLTPNEIQRLDDMPSLDSM
jgi:hypothetical protein